MMSLIELMPFSNNVVGESPSSSWMGCCWAPWAEPCFAGMAAPRWCGWWWEAAARTSRRSLVSTLAASSQQQLGRAGVWCLAHCLPLQQHQAAFTLWLFPWLLLVHSDSLYNEGNQRMPWQLSLDIYLHLMKSHDSHVVIICGWKSHSTANAIPGVCLSALTLKSNWRICRKKLSWEIQSQFYR